MGVSDPDLFHLHVLALAIVSRFLPELGIKPLHQAAVHRLHAFLLHLKGI